VPQIIRFGCAGVAVIIIAALTSVGLYAVLTGGFPFGGPAPKPLTGGAQVLVTIQAGQPTPTPPSASTRTPASGSALAPGAPASALAAPAAVAAARRPRSRLAHLRDPGRSGGAPAPVEPDAARPAARGDDI
jgi:hypothetical protein